MMLNPKLNLIQNRGLNVANTTCGANAIQADNAAFVNEIVANIHGNSSVLPLHPGFEIHPYKGLIQFNHAEKLIIGTFPPISYLIDNISQNHPALTTLLQPAHPHRVITKPTIPFFHGNMGTLWQLLLTDAELVALNTFLPDNRIGARNFLIQTLAGMGVYYDDIILCTQRKLGKLEYTYEDVNLKNICVDQSLIINAMTSVDTKTICFTNGATFRTSGLQLYKQPARIGQIRTNNTDALSLFLRGCQSLGLQIEMQCLPHYTWTPLQTLTNAQRSTKLIFELRFTKGPQCNHPGLNNFRSKELTVITPFSPAAHGNIEAHPVVTGYRAVNGQVTLVAILRNIYSRFRNNQHNQLYAYNI